MLPDGLTLLATVCNTTRNAVPFTLWLARGDRQYLVDLSDALNRTGDVGLTGLAWHNGLLYAAVQTSLSPRILVLDHRLAVVDVLTNPAFLDLHSLHVVGDALIVASTGNRAVLRIDLATRATSLVCGFDGAPHLNSAWVGPAGTLVCCQSAGDVLPEAQHGAVLDITNRRVVIDGLGHPHSLMPNGDGFLVLDSSGERVVRFDAGGMRQERRLAGFLRGCSAARGALYVASSGRRTVSRKDPDVSVARSYWEDMRQRVLLFELDEATLEPRATHEPLVAGFEIYELLALEADQAPDPPIARRLEPDLHMLTRVFYEAAQFAYAEQQRAAVRPG